MDFENLYQLQVKGFSFEEAKQLDSRGIKHNDAQALSDFCEEQEAGAERLNDLESRGFFHGTDNPYLIEQIERREAEDDRMQMFMNEY